ncbi:MAG: beta-ketoacyl synthase chain length factor [Desulfovibrio sp.]|nr:beta-ketoacyl synthase chain length factor [Desulfovibrio sp.]
MSTICRVHGIGICHQDNFTPQHLRRTPLLASYLFQAADKALTAADISSPPDDLAIIMAAPFPPTKISLDFLDSILDHGPQLSSPIAFSYSVNNMMAALLSIHLQTHGRCETISQFGLSFASALLLAATFLANKRMSFALVGVAEEKDARIQTLQNYCPNMRINYTAACCFLLGLDQNKIGLCIEKEERNTGTLSALEHALCIADLVTKKTGKATATASGLAMTVSVC